MKKYFFKTNRFKWLLADICAWLVCVGIADVLYYLLTKAHIVSLFRPMLMVVPILGKADGLMAKIAVLLLLAIFVGVLFIMVLFVTFPIIIIYYGVTKPMRKNQKARMRYDVISGIDYYRDEFRDLSPIDISLLSDLKVERRKDVVATLLSLEQKKWIRIQNGTVECLNGGEPLLYSEQELLRILATNQFHPGALARWEQASTQEAVRKGLLVNSRSSAKLVRKLLLFIALFIFSIIAFSDAKETGAEADIAFEQMAIVEEEQARRYASMGIDVDELPEKEQIKLVLEQLEEPAVQHVVVLLAKFLMQAICGLLVIILPFATVIYLVTYAVSHAASRPKYKRTQQGKILTEELAGMRNFIHDFSNLKEADKAQLALWNNFLVYAVVLEENQSIVQEIGRVHNVDLSKYNMIR